MSRRVEGLVWAKRLDGRPKGIPVGRARGPKALGVRYERALARAIPIGAHGTWWQFEDQNGLGCCQTDLLMVGRSGLMVLEAKYTYTPEAWEQLENLYLPVIRLAEGRPVFGMQVVKNLVPEANQAAVFISFREALRAASEGLARRVVLHWRGEAPLWPL